MTKSRILFSLIFCFLFVTKVHSQSKYLDTLRTTPALIGGIGISENSVSTLIGLNLSIKGSIDFGFQIGSIKLEDDPDVNPFKFDLTGTVISAYTNIFFANQRRGNPVNFAVTFGGSTSFFDDKEISNFGAGLQLSYRELKPQKVWATPTFEVFYSLLNEVRDTNNGNTYVGDAILSGSFSLGISTRMSDNNIFVFEPSLIYLKETKTLNFGFSVGIIF